MSPQNESYSSARIDLSHSSLLSSSECLELNPWNYRKQMIKVKNSNSLRILIKILILKLTSHALKKHSKPNNGHWTTITSLTLLWLDFYGFGNAAWILTDDSLDRSLVWRPRRDVHHLIGPARKITSRDGDKRTRIQWKSVIRKSKKNCFVGNIFLNICAIALGPENPALLSGAYITDFHHVKETNLPLPHSEGGTS